MTTLLIAYLSLSLLCMAYVHDDWEVVAIVTLWPVWLPICAIVLLSVFVAVWSLEGIVILSEVADKLMVKIWPNARQMNLRLWVQESIRDWAMRLPK